jgi:hypothetical protein
LTTFKEQLKEALVVGSEVADKVPNAEGAPAGAIAGDNAIKPGPIRLLTNAFKRLQARVGLLRTQSEPSAEAITEAERGEALSVPAVADIKVTGKTTGLSASEPSTPMMGADVPESLRTIGSTITRRNSSESRVPSFQTGFRPW